MRTPPIVVPNHGGGDGVFLVIGLIVLFLGAVAAMTLLVGRVSKGRIDWGWVPAVPASGLLFWATWEWVTIAAFWLGLAMGVGMVLTVAVALVGGIFKG